MTIRQRGNRWQADVKDNTETRFRYSFTSKAEAYAWEQSALAAIADNQPVPARDKIRRTDLIGDFYDDNKEIIWDGVTPNILSTARTVFRHIPRNTALADITTPVVLRMIKTMVKEGRANSTINNKLSFLSSILKHAKSLGYIEHLPNIKHRPVGQSNPRYVTKEMEERIKNYLMHRGLVDSWMYLQFLIYTGARFNEPKAITRDDIGQNSVIFTKTKSGKRRSVPLTSQAREALEHFLRKSDGRYVFDAIKYRREKGHWERMRRDFGLSDDPSFTVHILRHTCASRLVKAGVDLRRVKDWMGHSDISTTLVYANLVPEDLNTAAAALEGF